MAEYHPLMRGLEEYIYENFQSIHQKKFLREIVESIDDIYKPGILSNIIILKKLFVCFGEMIDFPFKIVVSFVIFSFLSEDGTISNILSGSASEEGKIGLIRAIKNKIWEFKLIGNVQEIPAFLENLDTVLYKLDYGDIDVKETI